MKRALQSTAALLALAATSIAQAGDGITIIWAAVDTPIPTLGSWAMIAMALLLATIGARLMKDRFPQARLMSVALLAGVLLVGTQVARTGGANLPDIIGGTCEGGSENYKSEAFLELFNKCPNAVQIIEYQYPESLPSCFELQDVCPVGTILPPGQGCIPVNYYSTENCDAG